MVGGLHEQIGFTERHLAIISKLLGSPVPLEIDDIAVRLNMLIIERDAARAGLAQAREVLLGLEWPTVSGRAYCPVCGLYDGYGHERDCALSAALSAKVE